MTRGFVPCSAVYASGQPSRGCATQHQPCSSHMVPGLLCRRCSFETVAVVEEILLLLLACASNLPTSSDGCWRIVLITGLLIHLSRLAGRAFQPKVMFFSGGSQFGIPQHCSACLEFQTITRRRFDFPSPVRFQIVLRIKQAYTLPQENVKGLGWPILRGVLHLLAPVGTKVAAPSGAAVSRFQWYFHMGRDNPMLFSTEPGLQRAAGTCC